MDGEALIIPAGAGRGERHSQSGEIKISPMKITMKYSWKSNNIKITLILWYILSPLKTELILENGSPFVDKRLVEQPHPR